MKTWIILATLIVVATAVPQGGFFSNLANRIRNSLRRPSRQTRHPPPQFRPNHPPQPALPPQRPPFNSVGGQQQQQHHHGQQHAHNPPPFNQPSQPSFVSNQVNGFKPQSFGSQQPSQISSFTHGCAHAQPNLERPDGSKFILTFLNGCNNFTAQEADDYCRNNGGRAISLDTTEKANYFNNKLAEHAQRYIWTGGRIDHNVGVVTWPSGAREGYVRGKRFWSYTGGASDTEDIPQPDNRDGNEVCIAILNNFYADGIKWHDVACHHRKPTICQL